MPHTSNGRHFQISFSWNLSGSILYEVAKTIHQAALLCCIRYTTYGIIGTVLSLVYTLARLSDLGASNALIPLYKRITESRSSFLRYFGGNCILPCIAAALVASCSAVILLQWFNFLQYFHPAGPVIIAALILCESLRGLLRSFLHTAFYSKSVVLLELSSFCLYLGALWFMIGKGIATPTSFLLIHLADSGFVVSIFLLLCYKKYASLPVGSPRNFLKAHDVHTLKLKTFLVRASKDLVSHNVLTAFAGLLLGAEKIGNFFFVSSATNSVQAIIKNCITYPGNAYLAHAHDDDKKTAFSAIARKFLYLLIPCIIIGIGEYHKIVWFFSTPDNPMPALVIIVLTVLLISIDLTFLLYEQFYIAQNVALRLVCFKGLEFCIIAICLLQTKIESIELILVALVITKLISISIISFDAYRQWDLSLPIRGFVSYTIFWLCIAYFLAILL